MLTRSLALVTIWFLLSTVVTFLRGTHVRSGNNLRSFLWLLTVILFGDLWAVFTFGLPAEIIVLSLVALGFGVLWIFLLPNWNGLGQTTWTMSILAAVLYTAYCFAVTSFTPLNPLGFLFSFVLFSAELFAIGLSLSFTFEMLDVCTRFRWNHLALPAQPVDGYTPMVSLQVPTYNEPVEVVEATLRGLARMNYPNYEVLLIDNNTPDEATWRPLEALCKELGPNFKCLHLDKWPGYKSGALNFALTQTDPAAEIIAIIDADYLVQPEYLNELVPYFIDPQLAFLQTPQDYRDYKGNPFLEACYNAYKYFFEVSMPSRNEHNAIIFCGTMGLIRKSVVQEIGGWDEWCITEDAEASLRILKLGYKSIYINQAYGHGVMPLNFEGLKKQRFRWCFGSIQVLRKHWESLMPWASWVDPTNHLTPSQRYYYLVAALQWFNESVTLGFTMLLLISTIATMLGLGTGIQPFTGVIAGVPLVFLVLGLARFLWTLRYRLHLGWIQALRAMGSFFSLSWVVTLASFQGLIQPRGVFLRTPKSKTESNFVRALLVTQWETGIGIAVGLTALALALSQPAFEGWLVVIFLTWQMCLYLAAPAYSLLSERGTKPIWVTSAGDIDGKVILENQAARWSVALASILLLGFLLFNLLPPPAETPIYAKLAPSSLDSQQLFRAHPISRGDNGNNGNNGNKGNKGNGNKGNNGNGKPKPNKPGKPVK
jgi:cellulose synthase/poly-beta-1,6-N-acetylglucosamine synthase-like glycosyltransferase